MKYLNFKFEVNLYLWGEKDIKYCSLFYFPTHMDSAKDKSQGNNKTSTIETLEKGVKYVQS